MPGRSPGKPAPRAAGASGGGRSTAHRQDQVPVLGVVDAVALPAVTGPAEVPAPAGTTFEYIAEGTAHATAVDHAVAGQVANVAWRCWPCGRSAARLTPDAGRPAR